MNGEEKEENLVVQHQILSQDRLQEQVLSLVSFSLYQFLSLQLHAWLSPEPPLLIFVSSLPQQLPSLTANQHKKRSPKFGH